MLVQALASNLLLLLLASQQQQTVDAWWLFGDPAPPMRQAVATIDMNGVKGTFKFTKQKGPNEPTVCEYDLYGLKGHNKFYHIHVKPLPTYDQEKVKNNATALAFLCSDTAVGGHLNPHHITAKLPPKSAPFDKYEIGDLAGKHGPLVKVAGADDHYAGSFTDDKLPMSGEHSIIGRSVVIHKNDSTRWVCATVFETK